LTPGYYALAYVHRADMIAQKHQNHRITKSSLGSSDVKTWTNAAHYEEK
jgi:hypothetical protein